MIDAIPPAWADVLSPALATPEAMRLAAGLREQEAAGQVIYPPEGQRLRALELTAPEAVKVVILGQDPYHGEGQAHGLAFSVPPGKKLPPSLRNIYKELEADCGTPPRLTGDLSDWARQGVLLLNNTLTVAAGEAGSHHKLGWEAVTDACVAAVARQDRPSVFILWGSHAQGKARRIPELREGTRHCVIESAHPSPLSAHRGFFGSRPFSRANAFLLAHGREPVRW